MSTNLNTNSLLLLLFLSRSVCICVCMSFLSFSLYMFKFWSISISSSLSLYPFCFLLYSHPAPSPSSMLAHIWSWSWILYIKCARAVTPCVGLMLNCCSLEAMDSPDDPTVLSLPLICWLCSAHSVPCHAPHSLLASVSLVQDRVMRGTRVLPCSNPLANNLCVFQCRPGRHFLAICGSYN